MSNYPFVYFMSAVVVPTIYWVISVEIAVAWKSPNDNTFTISFRQVNLAFTLFCIGRFVLTTARRCSQRS